MLTTPIYLRVSHSTRGIASDKGPSYPSLFSFKALSERAAAPTDFYGGVRMFNYDTFPADMNLSCCIPRQVDVTFTQTTATTAWHQHTVPTGQAKDFVFRYYCCSGAYNTILNDVVALSSTAWQFSIMKNANGADLANCTCSGEFPDACLGLLLLDMSTTHASDPTWERVEEFGVQYQSAVQAPDEPTPALNFAIASKDIGPVWLIQDSCECASLFTYPSSLPADLGIPGRATIQLSPDFSAVGGHPTFIGCLAPYYSEHPAPRGANIVNYILQNKPCAAAEVLLESSHMQLLLGYIDRNAAAGSEVAGEFYNGLGSFDDVEVLLRVEDRDNWVLPAGCTQGAPQTYGYATAGNAQTPGRDFVLEQLLPDATASCQSSSNDFTWTPIQPVQMGSDWIYYLRFEGDGGDPDVPFLKKLLGLRVVGVDEHVAEGPEIAHFELLSATLIPESGPHVDVNLGWSKAFRFVILDGQDP